MALTLVYRNQKEMDLAPSWLQPKLEVSWT